MSRSFRSPRTARRMTSAAGADFAEAPGDLLELVLEHGLDAERQRTVDRDAPDARSPVRELGRESVGIQPGAGRAANGNRVDGLLDQALVQREAGQADFDSGNVGEQVEEALRSRCVPGPPLVVIELEPVRQREDGRGDGRSFELERPAEDEVRPELEPREVDRADSTDEVGSAVNETADVRAAVVLRAHADEVSAFVCVAAVPFRRIHYEGGVDDDGNVYLLRDRSSVAERDRARSALQVGRVEEGGSTVVEGSA